MNDVARTFGVGTMFVLMLVLAPAANADRTIPSALFVSKSENKNQVHYGVRVDERCAFSSSAPVYGYWRMLERGQAATEPLLSREETAYGIASQRVTGDVVTVTLRALPTRPIAVHVERAEDGTCGAWAVTMIEGHRARLFNVHVALGFLRVDHLVLTGYAEPDGHVVRERIQP